MPWFTPSVDTVRRRIWKAWLRGDNTAMEAIAANFVRRRPDEPRAWVMWGNLRFKWGDFAGAEQVLREGLALHPSADPDLGWFLARAVGAQRRTDEAKEILDEQARIFPTSRLPYLGMLHLAVELEEWPEVARLVDETAARTPPGSSSGKYELAKELLYMPGRRDEAISMLREVVPEAGEPGPVLLLLGAVLESNADPESDRFLGLARKEWKGPVSFDSALDETRIHVRKFFPR